MSDADMTTAPFFTLYCEGRAVEDGILDAVEAWHESGDDEQRSLPEFLAGC